MTVAEKPAIGYTASDADRRVPEGLEPDDEREPWEIDRARILHSAAFRRLQRKTQVFAPAEGDFARTRLTHSLEVSQIAKGIALRVGANPTLCEAASLAHDIGHPPFGHAGERVLNECMQAAGGFEGNAQNLRVLTTLEVKSEAYEGLNLTRATLDALLKYKRSHSEAVAAGETKFFYDEDLPLVDWVCRGQRDGRPSFECQIMDWADDVAYSVHDVEDGLWAGLITSASLREDGPREAVLCAVPAVDEAAVDAVIRELEAVLATAGDRACKATRKAWSSRAIYAMVHAATAAPVHDDGRGPRYAWQLTVKPCIRAKSDILKALAEELIFRHPRVAAVQPRAQRVIHGLFSRLTAGDAEDLFPEDFRQLAADHYRITCDYISGMTDDYAERMYRRLRPSDTPARR